MNLLTTIDIYCGGPGSGRHKGNIKIKPGEDNHWKIPRGMGYRSENVMMVKTSKIRGEERKADLDKDRVAKYAKDMKKGDRFPMIEMHVKSSNDKIMKLGDGHHRLAAWRIVHGDKKTIPVVGYSNIFW